MNQSVNGIVISYHTALRFIIHRCITVFLFILYIISTFTAILSPTNINSVFQTYFYYRHYFNLFSPSTLLQLFLYFKSFSGINIIPTLFLDQRYFNILVFQTACLVSTSFQPIFPINNISTFILHFLSPFRRLQQLLPYRYSFSGLNFPNLPFINTFTTSPF